MKNIQRIVRQINQIYYMVYTATILSTIISYYLTMNSEETMNMKSNFTITLSSIIILYIIISIPASLALFHRNLKKIRVIEDDFVKFKKYTSAAQLRLFVVGFGLIISIIGHFILYVHTANFSMIFCALIAAGGLLFCKPTETKIISDLNIEEPEA